MPHKTLSIATFVALVAAVLALGSAPAGADNFTVTTTTDGGLGSLREAFDLANANPGPDTITLGSGLTYDLTLDGDDDNNVGGDLDSTEGAITIRGNGSTIRQTRAYRVIDQNASALLALENVTITGGNEAQAGGGVQAEGVVMVTDSTVTGNHSDRYGGGILADSDEITITRSTISGNSADDQGGGVYSHSQPMTVVRSTISGNSAANEGGGLYSVAELHVTNSTITANTAGGPGGGILAEGAELFTGSFVTITGNTSATGANIDLEDGELALFASVVSNPLGGGTNCADIGTSSTAGYNYEADGDTCGFSDATDTADGPDPQLGALAANGGPTQTMLPADTSPLVDAIPSSDPGCTGTDQRGVTRPQMLGCDIGAVELEPAPEPTTTTTTTAAALPVTPTSPTSAAVATTPAFTG